LVSPAVERILVVVVHIWKAEASPESLQEIDEEKISVNGFLYYVWELFGDVSV
jgi:hypothetical protein